MNKLKQYIENSINNYTKIIKAKHLDDHINGMLTAYKDVLHFLNDGKITHIRILAEVRYWEDIEINGVRGDEYGTNVPCKIGDEWCPMIEIETGTITNWTKGIRAETHFKVCDMCAYELYNDNGYCTYKSDYDYVPDTFAPNGEGYGDYIIFNIDENGKIENWKFNPEEFNLLK